jgi:LysR family transcriptional regulator, regulator for bpeEF and oprC
MTDTLDLELVVRIIEGGSLSGAARLLGVPRGTVARRLAALEDRLGVRLFQRSTRELCLTEAGRELHSRAQGIIRDIREMEEAIQRFDERPRGRLRIASPILGVGDVLAPLIARFCRQYPDVQVDLVLTSELDRLVARGFDLALAGALAPPGSLRVRRLFDTQMRLMASPGYLKRHGTPRSVEELSQHDTLVEIEQGTPLPWPLQAGGSFLCRRPRFEANSPDLLRQAAAAGMGIALLSRTLTRWDRADGRLVELLSEEVGETAAVNLLYPAREHLPARVRAFLDFAREQALRFDGGELLDMEEDG